MRFDVVSGWRKNRQDKEFGRKLPSRIANRLISAISGVTLHDYGCTLKAYRRDVLTDVRLYGEMHRFIPVYASWNGRARDRDGREPPSAHGGSLEIRPRPHGQGHPRPDGGVKFLASYTTNPIYLFGGFGLASLGLSAVLFAAALVYKLAGLKDLVQTPLPLLAVLFGVAGILSVLMGLLAELLVRTYYESQGKRPYAVVEELNRPSAGE